MKAIKFFKCSLFMRTLALILLCCTVLGCFLSLVGFIYCFESGEWHSNEPPAFTDSGMADSDIYSAMRQIEQYECFDSLLQMKAEGRNYALYFSDNLGITIKEAASGAVIYSRVGEGYIEVVVDEPFQMCTDRASRCWVYGWTDNRYDQETNSYIRYYYDDVSGEMVSFPEDFEPSFTAVTMTGYIRWPADMYSEVWFAYQLYQVLAATYKFLLPLCIGCAVASLLLLAFLLWSAGWKKGDEKPTLHFWHRIPLEAHAALWIFVVCFAVAANDYWYYGSDYITLLCVSVFVVVITFAAAMFLMTVAARIRCRALWSSTAVAWCLRMVARFFRALPSTWKYVVAYGGFMLINLFFGALGIGNLGYGGEVVCCMLFLADIAVLGIVVWYALQLKAIRQGARALAMGNINYKIDTRNMWPTFRRQANDLNSIALGMSRAVDARVKSEHFKTDLITNVSHDLKTPLTNIVSYVDLLRRAAPGSEEQEKYLDVLDRQAVKLKKLTEDLIDASKAASGSVSVNREMLDAGELLRQSAGEWTERLEKSGVTLVLKIPDSPVMVPADGRLIWRVFDNLLSNISKYSLTGTRAYIDLSPTPTGTAIVFRNISREQLGVPAAQLMERFVRGDASRHSEGSGLGLSIAASLTQLMGGRLDLSCEGDLFRAVVTLPPAAPVAVEKENAAHTEGEKAKERPNFAENSTTEPEQHE